MSARTGRFISLEGGEGTGKSTQRTALAHALRAAGLDVLETREPGGSAGAEDLRTLLMTGSDERWSPAAEALLFAAARADHVEKTIAPALAAGTWVVCDRFVDSTRAYQGGGGGIDDDAIMDLHRIGCGGLMPDRTFLLTVPPSVAAARLAARDGGNADRMGRKSADYHTRLTDRFAAMAAAEPARWRVIAADGAVDAVTSVMMAGLGDLIAQ